MKEEESYVYQKTNQTNEAEIEGFLNFFDQVLEMEKFELSCWRNKMERSSPMFMEFGQKLLVLKIAEVESLIEVCKTTNAILLEFWSKKFGKKGDA